MYICDVASIVYETGFVYVSVCVCVCVVYKNMYVGCLTLFTAYLVAGGLGLAGDLGLVEVGAALCLPIRGGDSVHNGLERSLQHHHISVSFVCEVASLPWDGESAKKNKEEERGQKLTRVHSDSSSS